MKKHGKRYREEQIIYALRQVEGGRKQLEDENTSLRELVADLSLDKHILQEIVTKKL